MISLGYVTWGTGPTIKMTLEYEKRRSGADMQYRAKVTIDPVTGDRYFGYPIYLALTLDSTTYDAVTMKTASPKQWSSAITYTSPWYTVSNKVSGTTPASFKIYSGSGSSRSYTFSYSMGVDPAASKVSVSNGTLASPLSLAVTRYNTGFTHTIKYYCGAKSGEVCSKSSRTTVSWGTDNGNVLALAAQNTTGQSVNVTFRIITYNGESVVGTSDDVTVSMAIPESVKPSVSLNVEDAAGYLATYGAYVQGWSKLKITATPTLAHESPIKTYAITADGKTYDTSPVTTGAVQGKNTLTITAKVTDNRSRPSDVVSKNITVLEYAKPAVTANAYRCNSSGEADPEGAYMVVGFDATIASLNGKNSASYTITYTGGSPITGSGTSYKSGAIPCNVDQICSVEVIVQDKLDRGTKSAVVPIAFTLMDFYYTGMGVALGKIATRDGFDCAMDAYFGNRPLKEVGSPTTNTDAVNLAYLIAAHGDIKADSTYTSCYYRSVGGQKEWLNPPMVVGEEYRTVERYNQKPVYKKMIDFGALPNAGIRDVAYYSNETARPISTEIMVGSDYDNLALTLPSHHAEIYGSVANYNYIRIITTNDRSDMRARVIVKYWKTTD